MGRVLLLVGVLLSDASAATADVHDFTLSKDQMHSASFARSYEWMVRSRSDLISSKPQLLRAGGSANLTVKKRECSFLRY